MLRVLAEILERRGSEGWLVGGSVRDRILARYSPDLDVAVADDAAAVAKEVAAALQAPWFALSERHPTYRVLGADGYVDVSTVRGDILCDLGQRDFTVNAMAVPVASAADEDAVSDDGADDDAEVHAAALEMVEDAPRRAVRPDQAGQNDVGVQNHAQHGRRAPAVQPFSVGRRCARAARTRRRETFTAASMSASVNDLPASASSAQS